MDATDEFHAHLDVCQRCREEIFNLCPIGAVLIAKAAIGVCDNHYRGLAQWNKVLGGETDGR